MDSTRQCNWSVAQVKDLLAECDRLRAECDDLRGGLTAAAENVCARRNELDTVEAERDALTARLAQAERVVEAARAVVAADGNRKYPNLDADRWNGKWQEALRALLAAVDALDGTAGQDDLEAARQAADQARAEYVASVRSRIGLGTAGPGEEGQD